MKIYNYIKNADESDMWLFTFDIHKLLLDKYFTCYWKDNIEQFPYSGNSLINEVNSLQPQSVLDVGCGNNYFKGKINNLIGIDPYNSAADEMLDLWKFNKKYPDQRFDVVLALGSINYGPLDKIMEEVQIIDNITVPGGHQFWRVSTQQIEDCGDFPLVNLIDVYPWTKSHVEKIADVYDYTIVQYEEEVVDGVKYLFFHYLKN